jgi:hypothetical protein
MLLDEAIFPRYVDARSSASEVEATMRPDVFGCVMLGGIVLIVIGCGLVAWLLWTR